MCLLDSQCAGVTQTLSDGNDNDVGKPNVLMLRKVSFLIVVL
ncbi:hypothetical protein PC116_g1114 [Phytophthora cactorum]|uniref:Uncharacterized protein n=1 Tax=Phytophthora cactorum TaxID=29920 RepID=A0A8T1LQH8_9STRA|nr:hypothetical protein Pcac1_g9023 [Phytophthora cactorum]KAG2932998.1 hypothetical protein PC114_g1603 [Phytophthora cactorum]KAG2955622.1 hypothetical protein PC117_g227 [Phytophthora cactorum]KAG3041260.1 hypothetical protein PC119_g818 [Phytophthora cactorum]KAG4063823.1 hypothetical protein PC123_g1338 [Phytophthora cactorum]